MSKPTPRGNLGKNINRALFEMMRKEEKFGYMKKHLYFCKYK
jgi:hypothetical protein